MEPVEGGQGGDVRVKNWAGVTPESDREDDRASGGLLSLGPVVVLVFVGEAILAKSLIPGVRVSFLAHMTATAVLLGALFWLGLQMPSDSEQEAAVDEKLRWIRVCVKLLVVWGFLSCFAQETVLANLAFWLLWAGNHYVIWWVVPRLLVDCDAKARQGLLTVILLTCVVGCALLHPVNGAPQGRLIGMFGNASWSGLFLMIALVHWTALWLHSRPTPRWLLPVAALTAMMLIMTRTRGCIAAALVGCAAVVLATAMGPSEKARSSALSTGLMIAALGVALTLALTSAYFDAEQTVRYLRIEGGWTAVYQARSGPWEQGYRNLWSHGGFGCGFMSKYGGATDTWEVLGVHFPRYDWMTDRDPLNMLFLTAQQVGLPGAIVLAMLLVALWKARRVLAPAQRAIFTGFLAAGVVTGLTNGNWMTSFGEPFDRFTMLAFSALLLAPAYRGEAAEVGEPARGRGAELRPS